MARIKNGFGPVFLRARIVRACRLSAFFLVATATTALAFQSGDFTYTVNSGTTTVTITGYTGPGGAVDIPSTIDGKIVSGIFNLAFGECTSLTSVTIPASVTEIGDYAFMSCTGLTNVMIGNGVSHIGLMTFALCPNLTSIYFTGNAPDVNSYVFYNDNNLTVYYLAGTTGWGATFGDRPTALWTAPATITTQPQSLTNNPGSSASFTVTAWGTAPLYYQWQKDGANIDSAHLATHTIASVAAGDAGNYRCLVANAAGTATSAVAVLTVNATPAPIVGPTIKANGATGTVTLHYSEPVSIIVEMNAGNYAGAEVDWWVVAFAHASQWFYLNNAMQWTPFSGDLALCQPVYPGPLCNLSATTVSDRYLLPIGTYDFWFAVDYPMDGILDPNGQILVDKVTVVVQ